MSAAQVIVQAQARGLQRLDAQLLLLHALGKPASERTWLLAHDLDPVPPAAQARFNEHVQRRAAGEPLAYITGHKEFFGLDLLVDARVLVPRPETEALVEWALEVLAELAVQPPTVLDLGTGSGAIALALKHARPDLEVTAVDHSTQALQVARGNAERLQLDVHLRHGCWFDGMAERFHVIVANPPYIASDDPHLQALGHEPTQALTSGADGLNDITQIVAHAAAHLHPGGWLLLEHGYDQAVVVRDKLIEAGFTSVQSRRDLSDIERCSGARSPADLQLRPGPQSP